MIHCFLLNLLVHNFLFIHRLKLKEEKSETKLDLSGTLQRQNKLNIFECSEMHHLNDATIKATGSPERIFNCEHTYHFRSYRPSV